MRKYAKISGLKVAKFSLCTGSNSKMLSSDIVTEFRDRGDEVRIYPLSFSEFYSAYKGDKSKAWREYYTYGGMPLAVTKKTPAEKSKYLKDLFTGTYIKDVLERHKVINDSSDLEELLNVISSSIGSLTNPLNLSNTFKMENIIFNELKIRGFDVDVGVVVHNTKDARGKSQRNYLEVDFIANMGSKRFYIQSALNIDDQEKKQQEINSLCRINDSFKKFVVIKDNIEPWQDDKGIQYIGIEQFLLEEDWLR